LRCGVLGDRGAGVYRRRWGHGRPGRATRQALDSASDTTARTATPEVGDDRLNDVGDDRLNAVCRGDGRPGLGTRQALDSASNTTTRTTTSVETRGGRLTAVRRGNGRPGRATWQALDSASNTTTRTTTANIGSDWLGIRVGGRRRSRRVRRAGAAEDPGIELEAFPGGRCRGNHDHGLTLLVLL
jgi:hypothetical protein